MTPLRGLCAALIATLGLLPLAPPAHVHDTVDEAGHHGVVAHRHAESHGPLEAVPVVRGHEPTHLEDPESVVATLDPVFLASRAFEDAAPALSTDAVVLGPVLVLTNTLEPFVERQIHGPPRAPTLLRGPPVLS